MVQFSSVTHVIFDMDGLLLNTEDIYTVATSMIAEKYGKSYTWDVKVKAMGKTANDSAQYIVNALDLPISAEEYSQSLDQITEKLFVDAELLPGVLELIQHLHKNNIPIAIATSSKSRTYNLKMTHHQEFLKMFHHVVCGSSDPEVKAGKPAPDVFLVCNNRFPEKPDPKKVLVFEDAPNGVVAAVAAGMSVVMIPDSRIDPKECELATLVLKSMTEFKPEMFGLPPFA